MGEVAAQLGDIVRVMSPAFTLDDRFGRQPERLRPRDMTAAHET